MPLTPAEAQNGFVFRRLDAASVSRLSARAKAADATLNDLFIAAFYCALIAATPDSQAQDLRIQIAVDLRRQLLPPHEPEPLSNQTSFEYPFLNRRRFTSFDDMLGFVAAYMRKARQEHLGILPYSFMPFLALMPYGVMKGFTRQIRRNPGSQRRAPVVLSNVGPIATEVTNFDAPAVTAWTLPLIIYPPNLSLVVSGYNGAITLNSALPLAAVPQMEVLVDHLLAVLSKCEREDHALLPN